MKKLFTKSSIMLIAAGLIVAGVSSAALVSYLSNEVTTSDTVITSPIELSLLGKKWSSETTNSWYTDWINLNHTIGTNGKLYGGSMYEVRMDRRNLANQDIKNYLEVRIEPSTGNLELGDIDLTMQYKPGTTWVNLPLAYFPCHTNFTYSNDGYYRTQIIDATPGLTKFKLKMDLNQALDPTDTYKMFIQALDPDVVPSNNTAIGVCPY